MACKKPERLPERPDDPPGPGRVSRSKGVHRLDNASHEAFAQAYLRSSSAKRAYEDAFPHTASMRDDTVKSRAVRLLRDPKVRRRIIYLQEKLTNERITRTAITQDSIDSSMWSVAERCLQRERVEVPQELKGRSFKPCDCESSEENQELLEDWQRFGGIYRFDANGSIKALLALGKDRGLYIDRKLVGHMEGDEIVDAMNDEEVRELVRSLAGQVGLRVVEAGSEGTPGPATKPDPDVPTLQ